MLEPLNAAGRPKAFDAFLRPPLRVVQMAVGIAGTVALGCYGWWWAMPLPLGASFLLYELFFWSRADKPVQVRFLQDRITIDDPFLKKHRTVQLDGVRSVTLVYRTHHSGDQEVVAVLADGDGPRLGLQFLVPPGAYTPQAGDIDADVCNAVLGSISGLSRAMCPREKLVRQPLTTLSPLTWLRTRLPDEAWARSGCRFWQGAAPELDLFGYHSHAPTGWLELEGPRVRWSSGSWESVEPHAPKRSEREAVLFRMEGEEHSETAEHLPLWRQPLGSHTMAIPAPLVDEEVPEGPGLATDRHVHPPEGAVILWHLWTTLPVESWPRAWGKALFDAQAHVPSWPEHLPPPPPGSPSLVRSQPDPEPRP